MDYTIIDLTNYFSEFPLSKEAGLQFLGKLLAVDTQLPQLRENLLKIATNVAKKVETSESSPIVTHLSIELAEFIAKRVFAFFRKGLWNSLQQKFLLCQNWPLDSVPIEFVLDFELSVQEFEQKFSPKKAEPENILDKEYNNSDNDSVFPIMNVTQGESLEESITNESEKVISNSSDVFLSDEPEQLVSDEIIPDELEKSLPIRQEQFRLPESQTFITQETPVVTKTPIQSYSETISTPPIIKPIDEEVDFVEIIDSAKIPEVPEEFEEILNSDSAINILAASDFEDILDSAKPPIISKDLPDSLAGVPIVVVSDEEEISEYRNLQAERLQKQRQTLLDIDVRPVNLSECKDLVLQHLKIGNFTALPRMLKGVLGRFNAKTQNKFQMMKCKDSLLRHENLVTAPLTIQAFLAFGWKFAEKIWDKLANLSNISDLNKIARQFLQHRFEEELELYIQQFRHSIELCKTEMAFQRILVEHPIYDKSMLQKYPKLQLVNKLQKIYEEFQKDRNNLHRILLNHFGPTEANFQRCLTKILEKNASFYKIAEEFQSAQDIHGLLKCLQHLKSNTELQRMASVLFDMVVLFLRGHHGVTFATLQTALNFLPSWIQRKILNILQKKLSLILQSKINEILESSGDAEKRWKKLLQLLHHPQFLTSNMELFSYPIATLVEKLDRLTRDPHPNKLFLQIFPPDVLPEKLRNLIFQANCRK